MGESGEHIACAMNNIYAPKYQTHFIHACHFTTFIQTKCVNTNLNKRNRLISAWWLIGGYQVNIQFISMKIHLFQFELLFLELIDSGCEICHLFSEFSNTNFYVNRIWKNRKKWFEYIANVDIHYSKKRCAASAN